MASTLSLRPAQVTTMISAYDQERVQYLQHFKASNDKRTGPQEEMRMTPLLSLIVKHTIDKPPCPQPVFPQARLLGKHVGDHDDIKPKEPVLHNVDAPNSTFICGSQGSGKSYTLSCMLENCLMNDKRYGKLNKPVAGVVFHYDTDSLSATAEAASLCSTGLKVRVLVSPASYKPLERAYKALKGADKQLTVIPLLFNDSHLTFSRMKRLMAFSEQEGTVPLYMEVVEQILRGMAIEGIDFSLAEFEQRKKKAGFDIGQDRMFNMRLNLLKSFMDPSSKGNSRDIFQLTPGTLTVIDLTDPFVDPATVCVLFDVCLGLVKHKRPSSGMVIALDEAHKYLNKSSAAATFTDGLLSTIRMQRHNATRVIIATQEPTISEKLLDLCSVSIIHHFNSPAWFGAIKGHLGGASGLTTSEREQKEMFEEIVDLQVGESLVFSPSSYLCVEDGTAKKLGSGVMKMLTRIRLGVDAGKSEMASIEKGGSGSAM